MERNAQRERIQGMPRKGALLTVSAALLMAGPVVDWLLSKVVEDYYTSVSIFFCLLTVVGGVLLLTARERKAGCAVGGALALFGAAVTMNRPLLLAAVAFWVISVVGTSWNKAPGFLPEKFRMPVLNLICVVLAAVSGLQSLPEVKYTPAWLAPLVLATVGAVLLCGNVQAEMFVSLTPEERARKEPGLRYRSVPAAGFLGFLGALLLLADGAWMMVNIFRLMSSFDVPLSNLLWPALTVAAGVLLLLRSQGEKRLLPAAVLLLIGQLRTLLVMREAAVYADQTAALQQTQQAALLFFSALLLLLSAVGFTWNRPVGKTRPLPVLNAVAAVLAAVNGIWATIDLISVSVEDAKSGAELDAGLAQNLLLGLLLPLGLVLVNLAMEARQAPPKAWKVDGEKYSRGLRGFVGSFYTGVGGKLQLLAKISGVLCLILGLLGVVMMLLSILLLLLQLFGLIPPYFEPLSLLLGGLAAVVSALLLAVGTWPLYAFGQIVSDLHAIRKDGVQASGTAGETAETGSADPKASAAQENPDELPEL